MAEDMGPTRHSGTVGILLKCREWDRIPEIRHVRSCVGGAAMEQGDRTQRGELSSSTVNTGTGRRLVQGTELADELGPIPSFPPVALDPGTGRMIPLSREELDERRDAALRMLKVLDQITDENDTDENWREVYRNIDAFRPHRPLFKELY